MSDTSPQLNVSGETSLLKLARDVARHPGLQVEKARLFGISVREVSRFTTLAWLYDEVAPQSEADQLSTAIHPSSMLRLIARAHRSTGGIGRHISHPANVLTQLCQQLKVTPLMEEVHEVIIRCWPTTEAWDDRTGRNIDASVFEDVKTGLLPDAFDRINSDPTMLEHVEIIAVVVAFLLENKAEIRVRRKSG